MRETVIITRPELEANLTENAAAIFNTTGLLLQREDHKLIVCVKRHLIEKLYCYPIDDNNLFRRFRQKLESYSKANPKVSSEDVVREVIDRINNRI